MNHNNLLIGVLREMKIILTDLLSVDTDKGNILKSIQPNTYSSSSLQLKNENYLEKDYIADIDKQIRDRVVLLGLRHGVISRSQQEESTPMSKKRKRHYRT